ncbi:hypothetical protein L6452_09542 [Arctium lappa]|uniref:Uncharacterized protein n=1 Tax=Arctium lappa TaxID=4217 RepID=A0ACB9DKK6_ARCLA|nr:hypothetical protein L6452_09542 [Arctium lappa]
MVELEEEAVVFPVVLYDGEREMDVGNIKIHHTLDFKQFQIMLKETIGISYNNLTTYLVESSKSKSPSERRKILITGKVNFSVLVRETNCYFLVVLKRSRRDRRRKPNKQSGIEFAFPTSVSPEYLLHLRRNQVDLIDGQMSSVYGSYCYGDLFHDLQMKRENYVNTVLNRNHACYLPLNVNFPRAEEAYSTVQSGGSRALCEDCAKAKKRGKTAAFHFCVYDDVIAGGFRSLVGPISRPG